MDVMDFMTLGHILGVVLGAEFGAFCELKSEQFLGTDFGPFVSSTRSSFWARILGRGSSSPILICSKTGDGKRPHIWSQNLAHKLETIDGTVFQSKSRGRFPSPILGPNWFQFLVHTVFRGAISEPKMGADSEPEFLSKIRADSDPKFLCKIGADSDPISAASLCQKRCVGACLTVSGGGARKRNFRKCVCCFFYAFVEGCVWLRACAYV